MSQVRMLHKGVFMLTIKQPAMMNYSAETQLFYKPSH